MRASWGAKYSEADFNLLLGALGGSGHAIYILDEVRKYNSKSSAHDVPHWIPPRGRRETRQAARHLDAHVSPSPAAPLASTPPPPTISLPLALALV